MLDGEIPYSDYYIEYPPGAFPVFVAPALVTDNAADYLYAFKLLMIVAYLAVLAATAWSLRLLRATRSHVMFALGLVALTPLLLGHVFLNRYDPWPAALVSVGFALLLAGFVRTSAGFIAGAFAAKILAASTVPVVAVRVWWTGGRRPLIGTAVTFAVVSCVFFVPFGLIAPGGLGFSLWTQARRHLHTESVGGSLLLAVDRLGLHDAQHYPRQARLGRSRRPSRAVGRHARDGHGDWRGSPRSRSATGGAPSRCARSRSRSQRRQWALPCSQKCSRRSSSSGSSRSSRSSRDVVEGWRPFYSGWRCSRLRSSNEAGRASRSELGRVGALRTQRAAGGGVRASRARAAGTPSHETTRPRQSCGICKDRDGPVKAASVGLRPCRPPLSRVGPGFLGSHLCEALLGTRPPRHLCRQSRNRIACEHRAPPERRVRLSAARPDASTSRSTSRSTSSITSRALPARSTTSVFPCRLSRSARTGRTTRSVSQRRSALGSCLPRRARCTATRRCIRSRRPTGGT